jgi:hypothetical protein
VRHKLVAFLGKGDIFHLDFGEGKDAENRKIEAHLLTAISGHNKVLGAKERRHYLMCLFRQYCGPRGNFLGLLIIAAINLCQTG